MAPDATQTALPRPLWLELALSAAFTLALVAYGAAAAYVGAALSESPSGASVFVVIVFLLTVPFLVYYAYPAGERRWWHYLLFEALVLGGFTLLLPLVYLPWRIVAKRGLWVL